MAISTLLVASSVSADALDVPPIQLQVGQRLDYTSTAQLVFPADDTILSVQRKDDTHITLVGLKAGITQVVFSDGGQLNNITVEVSTTLSAATLLLTPEFNTRYPFVLYEFSNASTFTQSAFFQDPNYSQSLALDSPFIGRGRLRANATYNQPYGGPNTISNGTLSIVNGSVDFLFGSLDAAIGRQTGAIISAVPGFGPRLRLLNPFLKSSSWNHTLNIFGGIQPQTDLQDIQDGQRKAGFNYTLSKNSTNSVFQDFFNIGFVAFQPPNITRYHFNGVLEGTRHIGRKVQLGGGAYLSNGGYGLLFTPIYQTASNLTQANLRFVRHGLEQVGGVVAPNDQHNYTLSTKQVFKDRISTLSATLQHQITVANPTLGVSGNNASNLQVSLFRQYTISQRYGGSYALSRTSSTTVDTYSNVITGYYTHPLTRQSYLQHSLSANQINTTGASTTRQLQLVEQLQYETLSQRHQIGLTPTYSESPNKQLGIVVNAISSFFFRGGTLQVSAGYTKNDVLDESHQFQLGPTLTYQPTTTQLISLASNANYQIAQSDNSLAGSFNIVYRRYMGPGVVRDSLIKRIFKTGSKVRIAGRVFLDANYNGRFEQGDIGLENVQISMDGKSKTITGPGGIFTMANIPIGQHTMIVEAAPIQNINRPTQFPVLINSESSKREIPLAVQEDRAIVTVRTILDTNDNKATDELDSLASVASVELQQGELHRSANAIEGGAIFNGINIGPATVLINPADIGDNLEAISPLTQTIQVSDYKEYIVNFIFKAIRGIKGRVIVEGNEKLHPKVTIKFGDISATPDKEGYYWLKDLKEGMFNLTVTGIPRGYCIVGGNTIPIQVSSPFTGQKDIVLTTQCHANTSP